MPRNALTAPASLPSTVPDAVLTCGPAAKTVNGAAIMIPASSAQRTILVVICFPHFHTQNIGLYRKESLLGFLIPRCHPARSVILSEAVLQAQRRDLSLNDRGASAKWLTILPGSL